MKWILFGETWFGGLKAFKLRDQASISPTFYVRLFHTKVLHKDLKYTHFRFELLSEYWRKFGHKMLVKLTTADTECAYGRKALFLFTIIFIEIFGQNLGCNKCANGLTQLCQTLSPTSPKSFKAYQRKSCLQNS